MTKAEEYETRENKASLFDLSSDPFQVVTGSGHRASISGMAGPAAAAAARRRSSAVAPDAHHPHHDGPEHAQTHHQRSGYDGDNNLTTIQSRVDRDEIRPSTDGPAATQTGPTTTTTTTTTTTSTAVNPASDVRVRDNSGHATGATGHTTFYDAATRDSENVGTHDKA